VFGVRVELISDEFVICHRLRRCSVDGKPAGLDHVRFRTNMRHIFVWPNGDVFSTIVTGRTDAMLKDVELTELEIQYCIDKCAELNILVPVFLPVARGRKQ
jgi:hypothetical protein